MRIEKGDILLFLENQNVPFLLSLADKASWKRPIKNWRFSGERVHWLYDEVDRAEEGLYAHEILFSDGRTLSLKFWNLVMVQMPLDANGSAGQILHSRVKAS